MWRVAIWFHRRIIGGFFQATFNGIHVGIAIFLHCSALWR
jgi:hypothetical protein